MARRAAKVDASQASIVQALEAAGASVLSLAPIGRGAPDLLAGLKRCPWPACKNGNDCKLAQDHLFLFEVKTGAAKTNELQRKWHAAWKTTVHVVRTPQEALAVIGAKP